MSPLVHLEDTSQDFEVADDAAEVEQLRRDRLSPQIRGLEDAVAQARADGDGEILVRRAQHRLQRALEAEAIAWKKARAKRAAENAKAAAKKKLAADKLEAKIREHGPYAEFHANGRILRIELQHPEAGTRGFAVEAIHRVARAAANGFQNKVAASRQRGAEVAEADWLSQMLNSSAGLLHAVKHAPADRRWGARPRETCSRAASAIW